jgi:hypothetical protein
MWFCIECGERPSDDEHLRLLHNYFMAGTEYACAQCGDGIVIDADEEIIEALRILNQRGWRTHLSCAGHVKMRDGQVQNTSCSVSFRPGTQPVPSVPKGFHHDARENKFINGEVQLVARDFDVVEPLAAREAGLQEAIEELRQWAETLPVVPPSTFRLPEVVEWVDNDDGSVTITTTILGENTDAV